MTRIEAMATRRSAPLAAAWLITALVCGPVGLLLFVSSERPVDRLLGAVLTGAGILASVAAAASFATGHAARPWSLALSGAFIPLGVVAAATTLTGTPVFVSDTLLVALPPIVGGLATAALARRR